MILVISGLTRGFPRLIKKMDEISKFLDEEVVIQLGKTDFVPKHAEYFTYVDEEDYINLLERARLIICHAGIGTILTAYEYDTPFIIVPRLQKYQEHFDDHQMEIAKKLDEEGIGSVVYDVENLETAINKIDEKKMKKLDKEKNLVKNLRNYLTELEKTIG